MRILATWINLSPDGFGINGVYFSWVVYKFQEGVSPRVVSSEIYLSLFEALLWLTTRRIRICIFLSMPPPVCGRYKEDRFQGESVATTILRVQAWIQRGNNMHRRWSTSCGGGNFDELFLKIFFYEDKSALWTY